MTKAFRNAIALVMIGLCLTLSRQLAAQERKLDLQFIPDDAIAAIVLHPKQLVSAPQAELWPTEILSAVGKQELGFDPADLEQIVAITGAPAAAQTFGGILRFSDPVDADDVAAKLSPRGVDQQLEGRKTRISPSDFDPSVAFIDDRTLVVAPRESLKWMLAAKPTGSPLRKLLAESKVDAVATSFVAVEPLRPMIAEDLRFLQRDVPPMFADLLDLPMTVDTIQLRVELAEVGQRGLKLTLDLGTSDADTAEGVARVVKQGMVNLKMMLIGEFANEMLNDADPEVAEASMKYFNRLGDYALKMLEPKTSGNHVVMKADVPVGPTELGMFAGFSLPAIGPARAAAQRAQSMNNLKQIGLAFHNYHDKTRRFPAQASYDADGKPLLSWRVHILPEIEEGALYREFKLDEPWDSVHNKKLIERMPQVYKHPEFDSPTDTVYQVIVGKGAAFEGKEGQRIASFTDGTSNTILAVEVAPEKAVPWTKPEDWEFDAEKEVDLNDFGGLWSGDVFNALFCDGHVEAFTRDLDLDTIKAFFTRAGGEMVRR